MLNVERVENSERNERWDIKSVLAWSTDYLTQKGSPSARLDAELLLAETLGCNRLQLYLAFDKPLADNERSTYRQMLKRRSSGEPVAYILGKKFFWQWEFNVSPEVLIPRPESELLIEQAAAFIRETNRAKPRILDVGTGSGCLAVSLALLFPGAEITAWDISSAALAVAKSNAKKFSVENVQFVEADLFSQWATLEAKSLDLIIANPPYIKEDDKEKLPVSVQRFEPHVALFAKAGGLAFHEFFALHAAEKLADDNSALMLEFGFDQAADIRALFANGWRAMQIKQDLAKVDRILIARK